MKLALRVALWYVAFSTLYILLSDQALLLLLSEQHGNHTVALQRMTQLQQIKGIVFIILSALLIAALIRHSEQARQRDDALLLRANRALRAISECNHLIFSATDETALLREFCRVLVDLAGYRMAWVGYAVRDAAKTVQPMAQAGFEDGYLDTLDISWADDERGQGPTGTAIRDGRPVVAADIHSDPRYAPWRAQALRHGYASSVAVPLICDDRIIGAFNIYASEPDAFDEKELELIVQLTAELSHGIHYLRTQGEHAHTWENLILSERLLREAQEVTDLGYYVFDVAQDRWQSSAVLDRVFGIADDYPRDAAHWLELIVPESRQEMAAYLQHILESGEKFDREYQIVRRNDGTRRWVTGLGKVDFDEQGRAVRMIGTIRDNTRLKESELELVRVNSGLEEKVAQEVEKNRQKDLMLVQQSRLAAMGEIVHNIAHQWRQPLSALGLIVANIKDAYKFGDLDLDMIERESSTANRIIQNLSTTIDNFRTYFSPSRNKRLFRVDSALREAITIVEITPSDIHITFSLHGDDNILLYGFVSDFSQVMINLLSNAKEALVARDVEMGQIDIDVSGDAQEVRVTVRDNAGGIPPDILEKIFSAYFSTKKTGSGLGLYTARMIVENSLGGRIEAGNREGGAEFIVALPAPQPDMARARARVQA